VNKAKKDQITRNVMELLVEEEIERQISRISSQISQYINRVEVATYALNRLPPLYASSHEGFNKQKLKGKAEFSVDVTKAVRQGFAAVQKDLLRNSTPLIAEEYRELEEAKKALQELVDFLPHREFSWENLVKVIKPVLIKLSKQPEFGKELLKTKSPSRSSSMWGNSVYRK
jgi:hypothetical protein